MFIAYSDDSNIAVNILNELCSIISNRGALLSLSLSSLS